MIYNNDYDNYIFYKLSFTINTIYTVICTILNTQKKSNCKPIRSRNYFINFCYKINYTEIVFVFENVRTKETTSN